MSEPAELTGPDLAQGIPLAQIPEGELFAAHAFGKPLVLVRRGDFVRAIGGKCTHYGGPLAEGLLVDDTVRCPWHHACFSLRTGEVVRAPALDPVPCWRIEQVGDKFHVREKLPAAEPKRLPQDSGTPRSVTILGGGAAGNAAAETLRREGYSGPITMLSADSSGPCDRPNLSKNFLAGTAPPEWIPLRSPEFYQEH